MCHIINWLISKEMNFIILKKYWNLYKKCGVDRRELRQIVFTTCYKYKYNGNQMNTKIMENNAKSFSLWAAVIGPSLDDNTFVIKRDVETLFFFNFERNDMTKISLLFFLKIVISLKFIEELISTSVKYFFFYCVKNFIGLKK